MTLRKTCQALTHRGNLGTIFQMLQLSHQELSKAWGNKIGSRRGSGLLAKMAGEDVYFMAEGSARCTPRMPVSSNKITFLLIKRLSNSALGPAFLMRDEVCLLNGVRNRWKCLRAKWERAQLGKLLKPISKTQKKPCWPTWVYCGVVNKGSIYASWPARAALNENKSASCKLNTFPSGHLSWKAIYIRKRPPCPKAGGEEKQRIWQDETQEEQDESQELGCKAACRGAAIVGQLNAPMCLSF